MTKVKCLLAACAMTAGLMATANAAVYVKYEGVDGEAKSAEQSEGAARQLKAGEEPQEAALLLPAVQSAREAATKRPARKKGNVETTWKVEEGEK